jgi:hypothetical protein
MGNQLTTRPTHKRVASLALSIVGAAFFIPLTIVEAGVHAWHLAKEWADE